MIAKKRTHDDVERETEEDLNLLPVKCLHDSHHQLSLPRLQHFCTTANFLYSKVANYSSDYKRPPNSVIASFFYCLQLLCENMYVIKNCRYHQVWEQGSFCVFLCHDSVAKCALLTLTVQQSMYIHCWFYNKNNNVSTKHVNKNNNVSTIITVCQQFLSVTAHKCTPVVFQQSIHLVYIHTSPCYDCMDVTTVAHISASCPGAWPHLDTRVDIFQPLPSHMHLWMTIWCVHPCSNQLRSHWKHTCTFWHSKQDIYGIHFIVRRSSHLTRMCGFRIRRAN